MKHPIMFNLPDGVKSSEAAMADFAYQLGKKRRFLRKWGTVGSGENEVLVDRKYWYPKHNLEANKELFQEIGMYEELKANNPQGIDSAWIYLNQSKIDASYSASLAGEAYDNQLMDNAISSRMNTILFEIDDFQLELQIKPNESLEWDTKTNTEIIDEIRTNYTTVYTNSTIVSDINNEVAIPASDTNPTAITDSDIDLTSRYVLFDPSLFEITKEKISIDLETQHQKDELSEPIVTKVYTYTATLKLTRYIQNYSEIVKHLGVNEQATAQLLGYVRPIVLESDSWFGSALRATYERTDAFFLNGSLRASIFHTDNLPTPVCNQIWSKAIDSGYQKKKVKWWKKLLVIIVVILCIIFPPFSTAGLSIVEIIAYTATVIALSLSVLAMAMVSWGDEAGASYSSKISGIAGKVAAIAGFTNMLISIKNMATKFATDTAQKGVIETITDAVTSKVKGYISTLRTSVIHQVQAFARVSNWVMDYKQAKDEEELASMRNELDKSNEAFNMVEKSREIGLAYVDQANKAKLLQKMECVNAGRYEEYTDPQSIFNIGPKYPVMHRIDKIGQIIG
jgi:hypothetical protein